ncbi:MAG: hypothetical protein HY747_01630 [Elusimicrobia bacterium]|nr:hypothetical protein [Elusimicrobiota bacterium]
MKRLLKAKERRRRELAQLPIEEKVKILVAIQHASNQIRISCGRKPLPEWKI